MQPAPSTHAPPLWHSPGVQATSLPVHPPPASHTSPSVHVTPSLHGSPVFLGGVGTAQRPDFLSQASPPLQPVSPGQLTGTPPTQTPLLHVSTCVHSSPSSHLKLETAEHAPSPGAPACFEHE